MADASAAVAVPIWEHLAGNDVTATQVLPLNPLRHPRQPLSRGLAVKVGSASLQRSPGSVAAEKMALQLLESAIRPRQIRALGEAPPGSTLMPMRKSWSKRNSFVAIQRKSAEDRRMADSMHSCIRG